MTRSKTLTPAAVSEAWLRRSAPEALQDFEHANCSITFAYSDPLQPVSSGMSWSSSGEGFLTTPGDSGELTPSQGTSSGVGETNIAAENTAYLPWPPCNGEPEQRGWTQENTIEQSYQQPLAHTLTRQFFLEAQTQSYETQRSFEPQTINLAQIDYETTADGTNQTASVFSAAERHSGVALHLASGPLYHISNAKNLGHAFVSSCFQWSDLSSTGTYEVAKGAFAHAIEIFKDLLLQNNPYLLTCLDAVLLMLETHDRLDGATTLFIRAKDAALKHLQSSDHAVISVIEIMLLQANKATGRHHAQAVSRLRKAREYFLEHTSSPRHPLVLITTHKLAWCLAMNQSTPDDKKEALYLLQHLQLDSDQTLTPKHRQSISIAMTKARVHRALGHRALWHHHAALSAMSEGLERMRLTFSIVHPYYASAQSQYARWLFSMHDDALDDAAEKAYLVAANGRFVYFGPDHPLSRKSFQDLSDFFEITRRDRWHCHGFVQLIHAREQCKDRTPRFSCPADG